MIKPLQCLSPAWAAVGLAASIGVAGCGHLTALVEETRTLHAAHVPQAAVRIESANGGISVEQSDREDVEIRATVRALTQERLQATRIVVERDAQNGLLIRAAWPEGARKSREGCSLEVRIPDARDVRLQTSNGALQIRQLTGQADLHTSNGKIEVQAHEGPLIAQTSNGSVSASAVRGAMDVQTSNGKITVADATSSVKARTSNGAIHLTLAHESPGPITARTSNGSITLDLGEAFAGELELQTSNGSLNVAEIPGAQVTSKNRKHARLVMGNAGPPSAATTSNGSIHVRPR